MGHLATSNLKGRALSSYVASPAPELSNLPTVEPNLPTKARKRHFRHFRDKKCVIEAFELGNGNTCK